MFISIFLNMLNKEAASSGNRPADIIGRLGLREGCAVADIGSGGGYFTLQFAGIVGTTGRVYAVDTKPKYLAFIRDRAQRAGSDNILFVPAAGDEVNLPEAGLDLVFMRNVFHHLPEPAKYVRDLKRFLKPGGKVAIIEHKPKGGFSFVALFKHHTPAAVIVQAMEEAGYSLAQSFDVLPDQTFNLFLVDGPLPA